MPGKANISAADNVRKLLNSPRMKVRCPKPAGIKIRQIKVDEYVDHTGEDALQVFVVVADQTTEKQLLWQNVEPIEQWIRDQLHEAGEPRFPYISFGTARDYEERYTYDPDSDE